MTNTKTRMSFAYVVLEILQFEVFYCDVGAFFDAWAHTVASCWGQNIDNL